jgi:hypothetical protein
VWIEVFKAHVLNMPSLRLVKYATIDQERMCKGLKYVFIKFSSTNLQKCITLPKNSKEGKQKWMKAYMATSFKS